MSSYRIVMVGTDGSDSSLRAVERAAAFAADSGATLLVACAFRPMAGRRRDEAEQQLGDLAYKVAGSHPAEEILLDAADRARAAGAPTVQTAAREGDPVDVLADLAAEHKVDLLVVGNRGLNSLAGRLLGSVPQNITHRAACDVLIVHTTGGRFRS
jgi:nucleotide-binding universal stress UspA family protein